MYVCVCKSITDRQIRQAVEDGHDSMAELKDELGLATGCGKCAPCARQLLNEIGRESAWCAVAIPVPVPG